MFWFQILQRRSNQPCWKNAEVNEFPLMFIFTFVICTDRMPQASIIWKSPLCWFIFLSMALDSFQRVSFHPNTNSTPALLLGQYQDFWLNWRLFTVLQWNITNMHMYVNLLNWKILSVLRFRSISKTCNAKGCHSAEEFWENELTPVLCDSFLYDRIFGLYRYPVILYSCWSFCTGSYRFTSRSFPGICSYRFTSRIFPGICSYRFTSRDFPVISSGCSMPIISIKVGAISARHPPSRSV